MVLETVLVTGDNSLALRQGPNVLFFGRPISRKRDLKKLNDFRLLFVADLMYI
jgi:hypothetical protein